MATQIALPKDAEGKEVPLDTETLYDEYGNQRRIVKFTYHHDCETGAKGWTVEYDNGVERFVSLMYLTQPDSWKKLEEDLNRATIDNGKEVECNYFGLPRCSKKCPAWGGDGCCTVTLAENILSRIRKLRGES